MPAKRFEIAAMNGIILWSDLFYLVAMTTCCSSIRRFFLLLAALSLLASPGMARTYVECADGTACSPPTTKKAHDCCGIAPQVAPARQCVIKKAAPLEALPAQTLAPSFAPDLFLGEVPPLTLPSHTLVAIVPPETRPSLWLAHFESCHAPRAPPLG